MAPTSDLEGLPNLGRTTVQWLKAVGIHTPDDLRARGVVNAYQAMADRGFRVTKAVLYALHGALTNRDWRVLTDAEKSALLSRQQTA